MSERTEHPVGVPGWVDILQSDPERATAFYAELFGWEAEDRSPAGAPGRYYMCRLRGRDVAGIGSRPEATVAPTWNSAWSMSMLNTAAVEDATRFYGALFGWTTSTFDVGGSEFTMWHLPGYVGGEPSQPVPRDVVAVMAPLADAGSARWDVDFWVHDADEVAAKATVLGGSVIVAPSDRPPFREAVVADPAGATVAVSQLLVGT